MCNINTSPEARISYMDEQDKQDFSIPFFILFIYATKKKGSNFVGVPL
jgi:hypothetical protein